MGTFSNHPDVISLIERPFEGDDTVNCIQTLYGRILSRWGETNKVLLVRILAPPTPAPLLITFLGF